ncbi:hypothetical protein [Streptomyces sp. NPDC090022]|uniref:hypothetical protein n=1 Tax=Streptomyces sp. NPDC090022 TaxID=3365920 RepID=UPI0038169679
MTRIGQAVILLHAGDREEARNRLGAIWAEIGEDGAALHRCTLAHYMADAQDDPVDELAWDLRALTAAEGLAGELDDGAAGDGAAGGDAAAGDAAAGAGEARGAFPGARPEPYEPPVAVRAFYPSLHLNLAADYLKLQRPEAARIHLARARAATAALSDDGYGDGVRAALARLERQLAAGPGEDPRPGPFPGQHP